MTIRHMKMVILVLAALLSLPACGGSEDGAPGAAAEEVRASIQAAEEAQDQARDALDAVDDLRTELDEALAALARSDARSERLADKLEGVTGRLWKSIAGLRGGLTDTQGDAEAAADTASSALSEVRSAAQELVVLEDRFRFHLKDSHGGG